MRFLIFIFLSAQFATAATEHGGTLQSKKDLTLEYVIKGAELDLYFWDGNGAVVDTSDMKVDATLEVKGRRVAIVEDPEEASDPSIGGGGGAATEFPRTPASGQMGAAGLLKKKSSVGKGSAGSSSQKITLDENGKYFYGDLNLNAGPKLLVKINASIVSSKKSAQFAFELKTDE